MECKDLRIIPQFTGTCWFNAFLMVSLYSQGGRKIMMKTALKWKKGNLLFKILKKILKLNYKSSIEAQDEIRKLFYIYKPEYILYKFYNKYDKNVINIIKNRKDFTWSHIYITKFLQHLGVNCLDINYFDNKVLFDVSKYIHLSFYNNNYFLNLDNNIYKSSISKIDNPDIIILYHEELIDFYVNYIKPIYDNIKKPDYSFDMDSIKKYNDFIIFNGNRYKLDSCLLVNVIDNIGGHAIAGITCNNVRYVYNGWINNFKLKKFRWDVRKDKQICFRNEKNKSCLSFNKGNKILLYVKEDNESIKSIESSSLKYESPIIKGIVNKLYDMNKLSIYTIRSRLINTYNYTIDELMKLNNKQTRNLYLSKLTKINH